MAWIYLAESEGLASHLSDGLSRSFTVKVIDTPKEFSYHEWQAADLLAHLSGTMFERSRVIAVSGSQSTSSTEDSPVRTSVVRAMELAWKESEVDFSLRSSDSLAIFDRGSFSWKTCQLSLLEDLSGFAWSSLRSGMIRGGRLYQPPQLAPVTDETDGGSLPTPRERLPTPTPTSTAYGSNQTDSPNAKRRASLNSMASRETIPTPMARDWKGAGGNRNSPDLPLTMGGTLNPQFVEEIMGYPIEWTGLEDWATQWFRSKRKQRSKD